MNSQINIQLILLIFIAFFTKNAVAEESSTESIWELFLVPILSHSSPPAPPLLSCATHEITSCYYWAENITGYEEVSRVFSPDCKVRFYEFGQYYHTGTWEPVSDTKVLVHNWYGSFEGIYINKNSYKEGNTTYSCGTKY